MSPENFEISRQRGFDVVGLKSRHRKKAERMALGDRVLFYVTGMQVFPLTATVSSTFFEDQTPIWISTERRPDVAPWRVQVRPDVTLQWYEYLDARQIAPRMLYVKRWAPEDWPLAFQGQIHLLSSQDFSLIEHEMKRTIDRRSRRRERPPQRPRPTLTITQTVVERLVVVEEVSTTLVAPSIVAAETPVTVEDGESLMVTPETPVPN
ncbi:MAG: EVE domain-containing protein [Chloroflexi bacterium]|nr:EVE domain-containing protein [Chloroflexota bacterium]